MMTKQVLYDSSTDPLSYLSITDCQSVENLSLQVHVRVGRPFYVQNPVQSIVSYFYNPRGVFFLRVQVIQFFYGV